MLSNLKSNIDFTKEALAEIVEDSYDVLPNDSVKVHIPIWMSNIEKGKPEEKPVPTNGYSVFKNAPECKPKLSKPIIKERNYLEAKMQNNSNIEQIKKLDEEDIPYLPTDAVIRTTFLNGKMKDLFYNTNTDHKR